MENESTNFIDQIVPLVLSSFDTAIKNGYIWFWELIQNFIAENWIAILSITIIILIVATFLALTGNWALLGSTLYHLIYWSVMYVIILVFGAETMGSNWLSMFGTLILYPISYFLTGRVLDRFRY